MPEKWLHPALIVRACLDVGWTIDDPDLPTHVAVGLGETDGNVWAHNNNPASGDDSWGFWQINTIGRIWAELQAKYGLTSKEQLLSLRLNARIARDYYLEKKTWTRWGAFKNGRYREDGRLEAAQDAVAIVKRNEDMSWTLAPCLKKMRGEADRLAPNRNRRSDGTIGDAAHRASRSEHNPDAQGVVRAIDLTHDPAGGWDCHKRVKQIIGDPRVLYILWDGAMIRSYPRSGFAPWQADRSKNWGHHQHMHVSIKDGTQFENDLQPWFEEEDWFDMATKEELKAVVDAAVAPIVRSNARQEARQHRIEDALRQLGAQIDEHDDGGSQ